MKTSIQKNPEILIVAGEASSTLYAQRLLEYWQSQNSKVKSFGVGSREMENLGFDIVGRSEEMAVVGFQEVISHYSDISKVFHNLIDEAKSRKPKVALLLDYPGFNLRLAKKLKKLNIPVVYYISPQIWAWKKSRIKIVQKYIDEMLVLFPFEKDFYEKNGVKVNFVGHPLLDELDDKYFTPEYQKEKRQRYGVLEGKKLLGLMPGSRNSEISHHLKTQLEVASELYKENSNLKIALFLAPSFDKEQFKAQLPQVDFPLMIIQDDPVEMILLADIILTASGTATLLVGLLEKPMVIMYKMNFLTAVLAKLIVRSTPFFGMINLVLNKLVVPEFFQEAASIKNLKSSLNVYLSDEEQYKKTVNELKGVKNLLGQTGTTMRVANELAKYLKNE